MPDTRPTSGRNAGRRGAPSRRRAGFTLIELIVVIVIIAVLAAVGAVAYNQYTDSAYKAELTASAHRIASEITADAARADLSSDAEVAAVWPTADTPGSQDGSAALKSALSVAYGGTLAYYAGEAGAAGQVEVTSPEPPHGKACIALTTVLSVLPTVSLGACSGDTGSGGSGDGNGSSLPAQCTSNPDGLVKDLCQAIETTKSYLAANPQYAGAYTADTVPADPTSAPFEVTAVDASSNDAPTPLSDGELIDPLTAALETELVVPPDAGSPSGYCWATGNDDYWSKMDPSGVYFYDSVLGTITHGSDNSTVDGPGPVEAYGPAGGVCEQAFQRLTTPTGPVTLSTLTGGNATITAVWDPDSSVTDNYTLTCTPVEADGTTPVPDDPALTATTDASTYTATFSPENGDAADNFVTYSCWVTGDSGAVPNANALTVTPTVTEIAPLPGCGDLDAQPDGTCTSVNPPVTLPEDPTTPTPPGDGYGTPPPDTTDQGLWGVTSFPSDDLSAPHVFYVTNSTDGSVYTIEQQSNTPVSGNKLQATVGYLFDPGTFDHPAGEVTGPSPLTGLNNGITTLYIVDAGDPGQNNGTVWRVDPYAHTRHKVAGNLDSPTEVTGFACYHPTTGTETSGECLYVATRSGIVALTLGPGGNATAQRTVTSLTASGLRLTSAGVLQAATTAGSVVAVNPGTGATGPTLYTGDGTALGGVSASVAGQDVFTSDGAGGSSNGMIVGVDGTVYATGLDQPRDVHDHWNAPYGYFTTPEGLYRVTLTGTSAGTIDQVWAFSPTIEEVGSLSNLFITHIAVTGGGTTYLLDESQDAVYKMTADGPLSVYAGQVGDSGFSGDGGPATAALLDAPEDIAVDSQGNLYIADGGNGRIRKVSAQTGVITTIAGNGDNDDYVISGVQAVDSPLTFPQQLAVGGNELYVDDDWNMISQVNLTTGVITRFNSIAGNYGCPASDGDGGPVANAEFYDVTGLAVAPDGNLFLADCNGIHKITPSGTLSLFETTAQLGTPDFRFGNQAFNAAGDLYMITQQPGYTPAPYPGFALVRISPAGAISTIPAGTFATSPFGDGGPLSNAGICDPEEVGMSLSGELYIVAEYELRKVAGLR